MTPTNKLRFVERTVLMHPFYKSIDAQGNTVRATQTYRVLQQWWAKTPHGAYPPDVGEWRDVPLEDEA